MSPRDSTDRLGSSRRAKPDVYTTMLAVSVIAILIAIAFLTLEMWDYDFDTSAYRLPDTYAAQQTALASVVPKASLRQPAGCQSRGHRGVAHHAASQASHAYS